MATTNGPYFPGQRPGPCGHYFPDVMRMFDTVSRSGQHWRVMWCCHCGRTRRMKIDRHTHSKTPGTTMRDFHRHRGEYIARFRERHGKGPFAVRRQKGGA